jgi:hypothetical protein
MLKKSGQSADPWGTAKRESGAHSGYFPFGPNQAMLAEDWQGVKRGRLGSRRSAAQAAAGLE